MDAVSTFSKIGVISRSFSSHKILRRELLECFPHVKFNETGRDFQKEELIHFLSDCDAVIVSTEKITPEVIQALPQIRLISKYGVGLDNLDLDALEAAHVKIAWQGGVNRRSVAELSLGFMLSALRHISFTHHQLKTGVWNKKQGRLLSGKTVGIVGCGFIGKDLVRLLDPFECTILVYDICNYADFYKEHGIQAVSLDTLLRESDLVSLHVPLNASTRGMIGARELSFMKKSSILINTARGHIVDEQALKKALEGGPLAAAAFDVYAVEPFTDESLLALDNFLATPHIAGNAEEAVLAMGRAAIRGLTHYSSVQDLKRSLEFTNA